MRYRYATTFFVVLLICSFASSAPVFAADCGGAAPCDCGDTVIASRTLDPGVDPICVNHCPSVGLFVTSNVTLNLDGCTIRGSGAAQGLRIVFGSTNVTLIGGTVTGFAQGVASRDDGVSSSRVKGMTVHRNATGIVLSGDGNTIELTTVRENTDAGIVITGDDNTVTTSTVSRNDGNGVTFTGNDGAVTRSRIELNVGAGLVLKGNGNEVARNYLQYNELDGLDLEGDDNLVSLNRIFANGRRPRKPINPEADGVHLRASSDLNTVSRNTINFNAGFGVNDDSGHVDNAFTGNSCKNNGLGPSDPAGRC
jgi:hypothetical protein